MRIVWSAVLKYNAPAVEALHAGSLEACTSPLAVRLLSPAPFPLKLAAVTAPPTARLPPTESAPPIVPEPVMAKLACCGAAPLPGSPNYLQNDGAACLLRRSPVVLKVVRAPRQRSSRIGQSGIVAAHRLRRTGPEV